MDKKLYFYRSPKIELSYKMPSFFEAFLVSFRSDVSASPPEFRFLSRRQVRFESENSVSLCWRRAARLQSASRDRRLALISARSWSSVGTGWSARRGEPFAKCSRFGKCWRKIDLNGYNTNHGKQKIWKGNVICARTKYSPLQM